MDSNDISAHEVVVYKALLEAEGKWQTNKQLEGPAEKIAASLPDLHISIAARTIRAHTARLVDANVAEVATVFPGYRYRIAERPDKAYVAKLRAAAEVLGLKL